MAWLELDGTRNGTRSGTRTGIRTVRRGALPGVAVLALFVGGLSGCKSADPSAGNAPPPSASAAEAPVDPKSKKHVTPKDCDAWSEHGASAAAPHEHLQISRLRALEAGRFLIRSTNDGITAVIGPHGEIVSRLPQFQEAVLRANVVPMTGMTPYARFGNYPVVAGALVLLAVARRRTQRPFTS